MRTLSCRFIPIWIGLTVAGALLAGQLFTGLGQVPATADQPMLDRLPVIKELPDPFLLNSGTRVASIKDWERRREEIKAMLLDYQYGHLAPAPGNLTARELSSRQLEAGGGSEKQLLLSMGPDRKVEYRLILTIPPGKGPFPVIVKGDLCWGRVSPEMISEAVKLRYMVAEFDRTEIAPDNADRTKGVHPQYPEHDWSTVAAWAWGFHRTVDYLWQLDSVDRKHIVITGHSRGGKAALLAGALDDRVALTAPNGSGCGGAGCYRVLGEKSEDIAAILNRFPYWFHPRFRQFIGHVEQLPFDQHFLKALVAPRAQFSTESVDDLWANPMGTQVSFLAARQVYQFLGADSKIGIHYRKGKHDHNGEDWTALLEFADLQFFNRKTETKFDQLPYANAPAAFSWTVPPRAEPLRVLVVTGGHDYETSFYGVFMGHDDLVWAHAVSSQAAFKSDIRKKYDLLVLYDYTQELDEAGRRNLRDFVEAGKGLVVLHHAICDYQDWDWWTQEVVGGKYLLKPEAGMPASTYKHDQELNVQPVGRHPITESIGPIHIWDETYKGKWISPGNRVLLTTDHPSSDPQIAWISAYPKSRVVFLALGHDSKAHNHPAFRALVRNAIFWSAGRLPAEPSR